MIEKEAVKIKAGAKVKIKIGSKIISGSILRGHGSKGYIVSYISSSSVQDFTTGKVTEEKFLRSSFFKHENILEDK